MAHILSNYHQWLFLEMALNGSSTEKEQTASWLRWIHNHIHGSISPDTQKELGIPEGVDAYGYINELKAYTVETFIWATIAFLERFGRKCVGDVDAIEMALMVK